MDKDPPNPTREKEGHLPSTAPTPISPTNPNAEPSGTAAQTPTGSPPGQPPAGIGSIPPMPPSSGESRSSLLQRWLDVIPIAILGALAAVLVTLAIILIKLIYPLPYPTRMYLALSGGAAVLVFAGLSFLIILIPAASRFLRSELRTELYSVRASSLCVIAGLIMLGVVAVGLVSAQLIQALRRP